MKTKFVVILGVFVLITSLLCIKVGKVVYWRLDVIYGEKNGTRVPIRGTKWKPGIWTSKQGNVYKINSRGYRDLFYEHVDVVCIGNSITFGWKSYKSYPKYLAEKTGLKVLNMGIPGQPLRICIQNLKRDGLPLKPKLVIYMGDLGFEDKDYEQMFKELDSICNLLIVIPHTLYEKTTDKWKKQWMSKFEKGRLTAMTYRHIDRPVSDSKYFTSMCHLNDIGNRILAWRIADEMGY